MKQEIVLFISLYHLLLLVPLSTTKAQWVQTSIPSSVSVFSILVSGSNICVGTDSAMYLSTDEGLTWLHPANIGEQSTELVYAIARNDSFVFTGTASHGVFRSSDLGASWQAVNSGLSNQNVSCITIGDSGIFVGTSGGGIFLSSNNGISWQAANNGLTNHQVAALAAASNGSGGSNIFAGTLGRGVFLSTNNGNSWRAVNSGLTDSTVYALAVGIGPDIFLGTFTAGVDLSTDNGTSWQPVNNGLTDLQVIALAVNPNSSSGSNIFAGAFRNGVFLSTNNGTSWGAIGLQNNDVNALAISSSYLFAGMNGGGGVWQIPLSYVLSVKPVQKNTPLRYALAQNYPNPFNPSTSISYGIAKQTHVRLQVFDLLGQLVQTIVDEDKVPGNYSVTWTPNNVASGLYFYRILAGEFIQTKKAVVLK